MTRGLVATLLGATLLTAGCAGSSESQDAPVASASADAQVAEQEFPDVLEVEVQAMKTLIQGRWLLLQ